MPSLPPSGQRPPDDREERARFDALGRMAALMAHDFNNVLAVVSGYSDLLQTSETLDPGAREDIAEIVRAADRGRALTRELAALARRPKVAIEPVVVNDAVRAAGDALATACPTVTLTLSLANGLPAVAADPTRLAEILAGLVANACDAMPAGGRLEIVTTLAEGDAGAVQIVVHDSGAGMDATTRERMFEPFFTTRRSSGHRGLGLTTARGSIVEMKGRITVDSEQGRGTTVVVTLPIWREGTA